MADRAPRLDPDAEPHEHGRSAGALTRGASGGRLPAASGARP
jgi:hypothetical protein